MRNVVSCRHALNILSGFKLLYPQNLICRLDGTKNTDDLVCRLVVVEVVNLLSCKCLDDPLYENSSFFIFSGAVFQRRDSLPKEAYKWKYLLGA